jgi:hypothetical protein
MDRQDLDWRKASYSNGSGDCVEVADAWRKASYSNGSGNCVEVADTARVVLVRDTTDRDGGTLTFTAGAWLEFTRRLR